MAWKLYTLLHRESSSSSSLSDEAEIRVNRNHKNKNNQSNNELPQVVSTESPEASPQERPPPRKVTFSTVQIRRYNRIVGDSPGCDFPLALGWHFKDSALEPIHEFDDSEHESNPEYITAKYMEPVTVETRKELLCLSGYSTKLMRQEERKRKIHMLVEWFNHGRNNAKEEWYTYQFPGNSQVLVERYVCERPCGHNPST